MTGIHRAIRGGLPMGTIFYDGGQPTSMASLMSILDLL